jgi:hypothetical protein
VEVITTNIQVNRKVALLEGNTGNVLQGEMYCPRQFSGALHARKECGMVWKISTKKNLYSPYTLTKTDCMYNVLVVSTILQANPRVRAQEN